jgi:hypothetical protein
VAPVVDLVAHERRKHTASDKVSKAWRLSDALKFRLRTPLIEVELAHNAASLLIASARPAATDELRTLATPFGVVEVYSRDRGYVIAIAGPYVIQILLEQTPTSVSVLSRALADLCTRNGKIGFLGIFEPDAKLGFPADVRESVNALIRRYSSRFSGAALIYEKQGFHATAIRSLVTAINVASRAQHPNRVFSDLREGVSWLSKLTAAEPTPAGLVRTVQMLRDSLRNGF